MGMTLTEQEAFDKAYLGVIAQGGPAVEMMGGSCKYITNDGSRSCGIGHIMDPTLRDSMTYMTYANVGSLSDKVRPDLPIDFMESLQKAHDLSVLDTWPNSKSGPLKPAYDRAFLDIFKMRMSQVATEYGLEIPNVK